MFSLFVICFLFQKAGNELWLSNATLAHHLTQDLPAHKGPSPTSPGQDTTRLCLLETEELQWNLITRAVTLHPAWTGYRFPRAGQGNLGHGRTNSAVSSSGQGMNAWTKTHNLQRARGDGPTSSEHSAVTTPHCVPGTEAPGTGTSSIGPKVASSGQRGGTAS